MYCHINFCLQSYTNLYIATENKDATKDLVYSLLVATNCSTMISVQASVQKK